jgi:hypothetical protein
MRLHFNPALSGQRDGISVGLILYSELRKSNDLSFPKPQGVQKARGGHVAATRAATLMVWVSSGLRRDLTRACWRPPLLSSATQTENLRSPSRMWQTESCRSELGEGNHGLGI